MKVESIRPLDTNGNILHAHGGQITIEGSYWYWIGEDRRGEQRISIYRSTDFISWEKRGGLAITSKVNFHVFPDWRHELIIDGIGCNLERPKVIKNDKTGLYVMWMHFETGRDYKAAEAAVAISTTIDGEYTYLGSFRPLKNMSRDITLFKDIDGKAYMLSTSDDNRTLKMYLLRDDYLTVEKDVNTLFTDCYREAPTVFRNSFGYYLLSSGCTGWNPNQAMYSRAESMEGKWADLKKLGDETTYHSQPTWVFEQKGQIYYLGDRWCGSGDAYFDSSYVILPMNTCDDGSISIVI